jgi:hypothetical protein
MGFPLLTPLVNAVVENLSSAPSSPQRGQIYFDTTSDRFFGFDGTGWVLMCIGLSNPNWVFAGPSTSPADYPTLRNLSYWDMPYNPPYAVTFASTTTFDLINGPNQAVTLTGNTTLALNLANMFNGSKLEITLKQDGTGGRTVTWFNNIRWQLGVVPTLTTTANKEDVFLIEQRAPNDYRGYVIGQGF